MSIIPIEGWISIVLFRSCWTHFIDIFIFFWPICMILFNILFVAESSRIYNRNIKKSTHFNRSVASIANSLNLHSQLPFISRSTPPPLLTSAMKVPHVTAAIIPILVSPETDTTSMTSSPDSLEYSIILPAKARWPQPAYLSLCMRLSHTTLKKWCAFSFQ